jgi:hypothetical protein
MKFWNYFKKPSKSNNQQFGHQYVKLVKFLEKEGKLLMKVPAWAICPMSKTLLVVPVLLITDGCTYEKICLSKRLNKEGGISSQSKLKYVENFTLKLAIEDACKNFVTKNITNIIDSIGKDKFEEFIDISEISPIPNKGIYLG